ncbi:MAG: aspartate ammonia-lyase [Oscillospiraceae bacterium]|nr:aspartate ammonia-lyase [Oscillospiraceae bacterium]
MNDYRLESDSIGTKEVPAGAYYGVQSLRAVENFSITGQQMHPEMIRSLAYIKKACAMANMEAENLDPVTGEAIVKACNLIIEGRFHDQFIVDPIQGGAGTSMNMNANEVIANAAIELLGGKCGDYSLVHPNDHVNRGQSTNDVIPTAGKMTVIALLSGLEKSLTALYKAFRKKAGEFDNILKMGRTQMEDAVPIRLGQEFNAYASATKRSLERIRKYESEMHMINMGGTAIGTGINANQSYFDNIARILSEVAGTKYTQADDLIDATQNIDCFAAISSSLKDCALTLSKIASDLRLMGSGPKTGFGEITLPAKQNGSSIMPGKVNPVIPEVVNQVAFRIIGNDVTISFAAESGQLELNAFEPVTFYSLFQSIDILKNAVDTFIVNCVDGITANEERCKELLEQSVGIVTALNPYIGYTASAKLAKEALATGVPIREIVLREGILTEEQMEHIMDPYRLTKPGFEKLK